MDAERPTPEGQRPEVARRKFLKLATALPVGAAIAALASPLLRMLKPNVGSLVARPDPQGPIRPGLLAPIVEDTPQGEETIAATMSEVAEPWSFKYFVFTQRYPQYDARGYKTANVPGVVVRLPYTIELPVGWARTIGKDPQVTESDIIVFSRICPHLGCIYNYVPNYREITAGYGGYVPPEQRQHALMGCPCHLSIYDPADREVPGRVLSGPAPRPPRTFLYEVRGQNIVATDVEPGGIA